MTFPNRHMFTVAAAALLALPLAGGAIAQQTNDATSGNADQPNTSPEQSSAANQSDETASEQPDVLLATVGDAEIRGSDVMTVIGVLPPELASQPQEMLVPIAMDQLILRELILQQALSENLAEDPEVRSLVEGSMAGAEEDAMVQVWIKREMDSAVTDEAVEQVYSDLQAQSEQEIPALAQLRPQIEQHLRQQRMQEIATRLQQGADIVFYDASGQPVEQQQAAGAANGANSPQSDGGSEESAADASGTSGSSQGG